MSLNLRLSSSLWHPQLRFMVIVVFKDWSNIFTHSQLHSDGTSSPLCVCLRASLIISEPANLFFLSLLLSSAPRRRLRHQNLRLQTRPHWWGWGRATGWNSSPRAWREPSGTSDSWCHTVSVHPGGSGWRRALHLLYVLLVFVWAALHPGSDGPQTQVWVHIEVRGEHGRPLPRLSAQTLRHGGAAPGPGFGLEDTGHRSASAAAAAGTGWKSLWDRTAGRWVTSHQRHTNNNQQPVQIFYRRKSSSM